MAKISKFISTFKEYMSLNPEFFQVLLALVLLLFTSHFLACFWAMAGPYARSNCLVMAGTAGSWHT